MAADLKDTGALVVRDYKGCPFYEAKWRDSTRAQRKRRLGRAWLERDAKNGGWCRRRGRVRDGCLDERRAYAAMAKAIAEHEAELRRAPENRDATFDEAVDAWLEYLQHEKRIKPSTLAAYRYLLAQPRRGKKRQRGARIMREFGERKLAGISTADVRRFLSALDREDVSARTVNIHRQVVHSIRPRERPSAQKTAQDPSRPSSRTRSWQSPSPRGPACTAAGPSTTTRPRPTRSGSE